MLEIPEIVYFLNRSHFGIFGKFDIVEIIYFILFKALKTQPVIARRSGFKGVAHLSPLFGVYRYFILPALERTVQPQLEKPVFHAIFRIDKG